MRCTGLQKLPDQMQNKINLQFADKFCLSIYKFHNKPFTAEYLCIFNIKLLPKDGIFKKYPNVFEKDNLVVASCRYTDETEAHDSSWCGFESHFPVNSTSDFPKKMNLLSLKMHRPLH